MICEFCNCELEEITCPTCGAVKIGTEEGDGIYRWCRKQITIGVAKQMFSKVGADVTLYENIPELFPQQNFLPYMVDFAEEDYNCVILCESSVPELWSRLRWVMDHAAAGCLIWVFFPLVKHMMIQDRIAHGWLGFDTVATVDSFKAMAAELGLEYRTNYENYIELQKPHAK